MIVDDFREINKRMNSNNTVDRSKMPSCIFCKHPHFSATTQPYSYDCYHPRILTSYRKTQRCIDIRSEGELCGTYGELYEERDG